MINKLKEIKKEKTESIIIPVLMNVKLEKTCHRITRYHKGFFQSKKQSDYIVKKALEGKDLDKLSEILQKEIVNYAEGSDKAIIFCGWIKNGRNNKKWYFVFFIDDQGVRLSIKISWFWQKVKRPGIPFSKDNYKDTKWRRREISAGENKDEQEWKHKTEIKFRREV